MRAFSWYVATFLGFLSLVAPGHTAEQVLMLPLEHAQQPATAFATKDNTKAMWRLLFDSHERTCARWNVALDAGKISALEMTYAMTSALVGSVEVSINVTQVPDAVSPVRQNCRDTVPGQPGLIGTISCLFPTPIAIRPWDPKHENPTTIELCRGADMPGDTAQGDLEVMSVRVHIQ